MILGVSDGSWMVSWGAVDRVAMRVLLDIVGGQKGSLLDRCIRLQQQQQQQRRRRRGLPRGPRLAPFVSNTELSSSSEMESEFQLSL